uniref:NADH-ubiquinone oxidoreductase chain 1 n=1 Tax=Chelonoidis abingdonii TaxID=106734 RepID=A0A8C0GUE7_CHEAB
MIYLYISESELVSGFNVEYAAGPFTLFFLAEYSNILIINTLTTILFLNPAPPLSLLVITAQSINTPLILTLGLTSAITGG